MKRIRGFDDGREIRAFKTPAFPLVGCPCQAGDNARRAAFQIDTKVVTAFELWPELDARQRVLWPSTIQLSLEYFNSLRQHAVPLNEAGLPL